MLERKRALLCIWAAWEPYDHGGHLTPTQIRSSSELLAHPSDDLTSGVPVYVGITLLAASFRLVQEKYANGDDVP